MEVITRRMDVEVFDVPSQKEKIDDSSNGEVAVVILNDDETTMSYVVGVLSSVFSLDHNQSQETMMLAHTSGSATVGYYSEKKAIALLTKVDSKNKQSGNHLRCLLVDIG